MFLLLLKFKSRTKQSQNTITVNKCYLDFNTLN